MRHTHRPLLWRLYLVGSEAFEGIHKPLEPLQRGDVLLGLALFKTSRNLDESPHLERQQRPSKLGRLKRDGYSAGVRAKRSDGVRGGREGPQSHLGHLGLNEAVEREVRRMDPHLPADLVNPTQIKERAHRLRDRIPY